MLYWIYLENIFGNVIFIAGLTILVNNLGSLVVSSMSLRRPREYSQPFGTFCFSRLQVLKTCLRYIQMDLRLGLNDDIIKATMFQRCNTQNFCLPYFWTKLKTGNTFFSIRSFVNYYRSFAKCGVSDNELTIPPLTYTIAVLNCFAENKFYCLWSSFCWIILQFALNFQGSMSH